MPYLKNYARAADSRCSAGASSDTSNTTNSMKQNKILALDLATQTGWASSWTNGKGTIFSGTVGFQVKKFDGAGMRYLKFENWLRNMIALGEPDVVYFEGVRRHMGVDAAHVYGGMLATMQKVLEELKVPYCALSVQQIKKFATGKGSAKKDAMLEAAKNKWPDRTFADDNEVDALWILETARSL